MKKLLLLLPILVVSLTGCGADMKAMEEAYAEFKTNMEGGYVITEEIDGAVVILDFTSNEEYTVHYDFEGLKYSLICGDPEVATIKFEDEDAITDAEFVESCTEMFDVMHEDVANNVEHDMYFDSAYNIVYEETETGFEANGEYEDKTPNKLIITDENTKVIFEDDESKITVELKK